MPDEPYNESDMERWDAEMTYQEPERHDDELASFVKDVAALYLYGLVAYEYQPYYNAIARPNDADEVRKDDERD